MYAMKDTIVVGVYYKLYFAKYNKLKKPEKHRALSMKMCGCINGRIEEKIFE